MGKKRDKKNQQDIERFERAPWMILFVVAIAKDVIDPIPVITIIIDVTTVPFFLYFLLRYTRKEERVLAGVVMSLEMMPFVGILPMTTGSFLLIYKMMEKKHDRAKKIEEQIEEQSLQSE